MDSTWGGDVVSAAGSRARGWDWEFVGVLSIFVAAGTKLRKRVVVASGGREPSQIVAWIGYTRGCSSSSIGSVALSWHGLNEGINCTM